MKKFVLLLPLVLGLTLVGCDNYDDVSIKASRTVIENRKLHAQEIVNATNTCVKNATSVTNLSLEESSFYLVPSVIEKCKYQAQEAFGAKSPFREDYLLRLANTELTNERN